ncbi:MAG: Fic family protein, partial [Candidatus Eremiobacterota bacterium]
MEASYIYRWKPVDGLGAGWRELCPDERAELRVLERVWNDQRALLSQSESLQRFHEELKREWAIETGILERLYTLDRGTTQFLIQRGIDEALISPAATNRSPRLVASLIRDQYEAVNWLFDFVKGERPLGTSFIKELHRLLTSHQDNCEGVNSQGNRVLVPLRKGDYKLLPNNP